MILNYRSTLIYTPITNSNSHQYQNNQNDLRICIAVRKRLLNKHEITKKDHYVITIPNKDHCLVHVTKLKVDLTINILIIKHLNKKIFLEKSKIYR